MPSARCGLIVALTVFAGSAPGCRATPAAEARPSALPSASANPAGASTSKAKQRKVRTELYFGLGRNGGGEISAAEWTTFLDQEVTPLFPAGFTVVDAYGQWKNAAGVVVRERSKILILLHDEDAASAGNLEAVRNAYKRRFGQESVIRSNQAADVDF